MMAPTAVKGPMKSAAMGKLAGVVAENRHARVTGWHSS
jgi:hypothetical protein